MFLIWGVGIDYFLSNLEKRLHHQMVLIVQIVVWFHITQCLGRDDLNTSTYPYEKHLRRVKVSFSNGLVAEDDDDQPLPLVSSQT